MLPTVEQVLDMDAVRRGEPQVVAGHSGLDRPVRWVHVIELADAARLLRGGELVLSTGIALPGDDASLTGYVANLAEAGIAGIAVELGRRYREELPAALVAAAEAAGMPLVVFRREVPFVGITEAVHARIIDEQSAELRQAARLHEVFTDLAVAGAAAEEVVRQAAVLAGRPVILADLSGHVLVCETAGCDLAPLLAEFAGPTPVTVPAGRTGYDPGRGWLVTTVGARGEDWGHIVLVCDGTPLPVDTVLVERTAATLALGRLLARQRESLERQAHRTLLAALLAQAYAGPEEAEVRARALGLPVDGRRLVGMVARFRATVPGLPAQAWVLEAAEAMAGACRAARIPALVGSLDDERAGALLALDRRTDESRALATVCAAVLQRVTGHTRHSPAAPAGEPVIGVGSAVASLTEARSSLQEAQQAADAAAQGPAAPGRLYHRLTDLRLRGLLSLLGSDARLTTFTERELGPLLAYDRAHGSNLTGVLGEYLACGGNKVLTAARAHLARPTLYERLRHIEHILQVSLDSPASRASLHVALLAAESAGRIQGTARSPDLS